jgi:Ca2+-binding RTX toxin-like protein
MANSPLLILAAGLTICSIIVSAHFSFFIHYADGGRLRGTPQTDNLTGTEENDRISGSGGNDILVGLGGMM